MSPSIWSPRRLGEPDLPSGLFTVTRPQGRRLSKHIKQPEKRRHMTKREKKPNLHFVPDIIRLQPAPTHFYSPDRLPGLQQCVCQPENSSCSRPKKKKKKKKSRKRSKMLHLFQSVSVVLLFADLAERRDQSLLCCFIFSGLDGWRSGDQLAQKMALE